jgi:hypothetical protein
VTLVTAYRTDRPQQINELTLRLDDESQLSISALHVEYNRSYVQFSLVAAASLAGLILAGLLIRR